MKTYQALNIREFFNVEEMKKKNISCWLLYQTNEETGRSIKLMSYGVQCTSIQSVDLESLCYILYEEGEYYKKESLVEQVKSYRFDIEELLLKEGFQISISEEIREDLKFNPLKMWRALRREDIAEIIADDFKGFCVFHPIEKKRYRITGLGSGNWEEEQRREIEICYRPNVKQLGNVFLDAIFCKLNLKNETFDYKKYFTKLLVDEQMILANEDCLELYSILEENTEKFYINGKETNVSKRDGEVQMEQKDVYFFKKDSAAPTELYYDGKVIKTVDYTTKDFFSWWVNGRLDKSINKMIIMGLL